MILFQTPNRLEPVLADKEVLLTALNIKSMNFSEEETPGAEVLDEGDSSRPNGAPGSQHQSNDSIVEQLMGGPRKLGGKSSTPIIVDLAFASNVRFLDDHELYLDNVELYRVSYETTFSMSARWTKQKLVHFVGQPILDWFASSRP